MAKLENFNGYYCESEFEFAFIAFLEANGWNYSSGDFIKRETKKDVLIEEDFKSFLSDQHPELDEEGMVIESAE